MFLKILGAQQLKTTGLGVSAECAPCLLPSLAAFPVAQALDPGAMATSLDSRGLSPPPPFPQDLP